MKNKNILDQITFEYLREIFACVCGGGVDGGSVDFFFVCKMGGDM